MLQPLHVIGLILVIVGAINWGLIGLFQIDLIATYCGGESALVSRCLYTLIGLAGMMLAATTLAVFSDWRTPNFSRR